MKPISRRQFMVTLGGFAIAATMSGCGWFADKPITIASHVWIGYEPIFLARSEGWLDTNQVRLFETKSASDSLQALADGKVDGATLTLDEVLTARSRGIPLSVVMIFDISVGADMLISRSGIKKLADLKGLRIGVEQTAVGGLMLANILRAAGLKKTDLKIVSLTIDRQAEAWAFHKVDAMITYEPVASKMLDQGGIKLFDSRQIPNTIVDVLAIRSDVLDHGHSASVRHLISAYFKALDHLNRNPHDAAYRMASHLNLPEDNVLKSYKGLLLPDAANNRRMLTGYQPELLDTARKVFSVMVESELLPRDSNLNGLIRPEFLPDAGMN